MIGPQIQFVPGSPVDALATVGMVDGDDDPIICPAARLLHHLRVLLGLVTLQHTN